ncbi:ABC transporter, (CT family), partial [Reticulomyxa filosa]
MTHATRVQKLKQELAELKMSKFELIRSTSCELDHLRRIIHTLVSKQPAWNGASSERKVENSTTPQTKERAGLKSEDNNNNNDNSNSNSKNKDSDNTSKNSNDAVNINGNTNANTNKKLKKKYENFGSLHFSGVNPMEIMYIKKEEG